MTQLRLSLTSRGLRCGCVGAMQEMTKRAAEVGVLFVKNEWHSMTDLHPSIGTRRDPRGLDFDLHVNVIDEPCFPYVSGDYGPRHAGSGHPSG